MVSLGRLHHTNHTTVHQALERLPHSSSTAVDQWVGYQFRARHRLISGLQPVENALAHGSRPCLQLLGTLGFHQRHGQIHVLCLEQLLTTAANAALTDADHALVRLEPGVFLGAGDVPHLSNGRSDGS